ncbi:E3 ubiquitin-protein ligase ZNF598 [Nematocida major]|uniref:E3 ubiquitin-protein ligase ZNF598 n=1 Tax=Nematocida major TaxID=1912982 RepID=UPI0020077F5D|nr:E3 ubiquitin-protein ligase ZNF598 [Nematocida major]KAH9385231.1 E3 ubiquitin-protein ligase ZNF598 [Nematocida major]
MEEDACIICYDEYTIGIVTECGHKCCLKCGLRYKFISNKSGCPICLREVPDEEMMFKVTKSQNERFSHTESSYVWANCIVCNPDEIERIEEIMARSCKMCKSEFYDSETLMKHYVSKHKRYLCELCVEFRCEFPFEYVVYSMEELAKHRTDKSVGNNHPMCGFCRERFYTPEILVKHCKKAHEVCYLCERLGKKNEYYKNYQELENHFKKIHYTCTEKMCLDARCYAFIDEVELAAHKASVHPAKKEKKVKLQCPVSSERRRQQAPQREEPRVEEVPKHLDRDELLRNRNMKEKYTAMIKRTYKPANELTELSSKYDEMKITLEEFVQEVQKNLTDEKTIEFIEKMTTYLMPDRMEEIKSKFPKIRRTIEFSPSKPLAQSHAVSGERPANREEDVPESPNTLEQACEKAAPAARPPKTKDVKLAWSSALTKSAWLNKPGPSVIKPVHISNLEIKLPQAKKRQEKKEK